MLGNHEGAFQVVVGFDFSDQSRLALDHALALAPLHGATVVHVLGVLDPSKGLEPYGHDGHVDFAAAEAVQNEIAEIVADKVATMGVETIHHYVHARIGDAAKELVSLADETNANLIVVGTHGRKGVSRLVMGSVAEKVVRHGTCPVLVVRPMHHPASDDEAFQPEPPCPECVQARIDSHGKQWWCETHAKHRSVPHPVASSHAAAAGLTERWSKFNR